MGSKLSESDLSILVSCFKNSAKPSIDFTAVAQECGLASSTAAYKRHWNIMRKLGMDSSNSTKAKPKTTVESKPKPIVKHPVPIARLAHDSLGKPNAKAEVNGKRKRKSSLFEESTMKRIKQEEGADGEGEPSPGFKSEDLEIPSDEDEDGPDSIDTPCKKQVGNA